MDIITLLEQDHLDPTLYQITREKQKLEEDTKIIQADDRLIIQAEYRPGSLSNRRDLRLVPNFITDVMMKKQAYDPVITHHVSLDNQGCVMKRISTDEYNRLGDQSGWHPAHEYAYKVNEDTIARYSANKLSFEINRLQSFAGSRLNYIIDSLYESRLFDIRHRSAEPSNKQKYDAIWQVLAKHFYIAEYEWGITFDENISRLMYKALVKLAKANKNIRREGNTFYLHDSDYGMFKVKFYNISAADSSRLGCNPEYREGDRLKFEITYKREFFRNNSFLVNELTFQDLIAGKLYKYNKKMLEDYFFKPASAIDGRLFREILNTAKVMTLSELMSILQDPKTTQTAIDKRLDKIEQNVNYLASIVETLADNDKKQQLEIDLLKRQFAEFMDSKQEKRKLRVVE